MVIGEQIHKVMKLLNVNNNHLIVKEGMEVLHVLKEILEHYVVIVIIMLNIGKIHILWMYMEIVQYVKVMHLIFQK